MPLSGRSARHRRPPRIGENIARELRGGRHASPRHGPDAGAGRIGRRSDIGGRALVGDVSKREDVERWASEAGDVDLLVCNAGMSGLETPLGDPDEWWRTFEVNVLGLYLCCNAFAPGMVERGSGRPVEYRERRGPHLPPARGPAARLRREQGGPSTGSRSCSRSTSRRRMPSSSPSAPAS